MAVTEENLPSANQERPIGFGRLKRKEAGDPWALAFSPASEMRLAELDTTRVRLAKKRSGINGACERDSIATIVASSAAPPSSGSSTCDEPHECFVACRSP